ncbi:MAG: glutamate--tRNA ligase [Deltaproteobacteria bacterium GWF2_42_12]|nr:MAG: glutamate--tRNA ligase [Deltaproteobacteria bacterium GWB2_42_7]OGP40448.1 MAG: glutamate--tRNA ligase [Deltaproteobacteria bacterium GWD2_42_10]OGP46995.1 MAG: glutamate--tRNA ligase [Deltaproteobacteria bacterium GWF2_42_12]OGQ72810.1 MAG: glutamate--tRNA ligase [Deltaproteobacteria bacterium RIFOXYA2_FULL_42_10]
MTTDNKIRVRFAPSPTGHLHIGNARAALFNWLFARQKAGQFVLRIEDTDVERSTKAFEQSILEDLKWLGLDWDEGPDKGGPFGPYRQSERFGIYKEYSDKLITQGNAYPCYCTHERLEELRQRQIKAGWPPKYDGRCRTLPKNERPKDIKPVLRFKSPEKTVTFEDKVHRKLLFDSNVFGDFIIVGSDDIATYNFAVVIDDALMGITHVIRGEDHLSNTPRQILIFEALGFPVPEYAHMSLIFGPDRTPLSKRHGAASINDLKESGFLPEAILNHLCHLGFSPGKEFLFREDAIKVFSLNKLSRSPAIFDIERLKTFNRAYIEKADTERLVELVGPHLQESISKEWLKNAVDASKGEAMTLKQISDIILPLLAPPIFEKDAEKILEESYTKKILGILAEEIQKEPDLSSDTYNKIISKIKQRTGESGKRLFMPIRVALTGRVTGIELEKVFMLLGKKGVVDRVKKHL